MRSLHVFIATLLVLPILGSDSPKGYDDRAQDSGIEGAWRFVYYEIGGVKTEVAAVSPCIYKGGKFTWSGRNEVSGSYTVDTRFRPARLAQCIMNTTYKCIFRVDGDTLRVAYWRKGDDYPVDFIDSDNLVVEVYRRVR
jgi:uncharacterized protein (TIGR03067 family)